MNLSHSPASHGPELTPAASVRLSSVPRCLRHFHPNNALEVAEYLAAFLQNVVGSLLIEGNGLPNKDGSDMGLSLCFDLLRDKIAIASGEMAFPLCGPSHDHNLPPLWEPARGDAGHE